MNTSILRLRKLIKPLFSVLFVLYVVVRPSRSETSDAPNGGWWLEVASAKHMCRVRPDGSGWQEVPHVARRGALSPDPARRGARSPDGKRIVYADVPEDNRPRSNAEIFVAYADGANIRRLTKGKTQNAWPSWTPDGKRIVFASNRNNDVWQVYAMDADGSNVGRLTNELEGAEHPKLAPDGRLAYLAQHGRQGKLRFQDLVIRDGTKSTAVVQNAWLYSDYAWNPDGTAIAYGKIGELVFHDLASGKERKISFARDIDPMMGSHAAFNIAWRPDGKAIACSITFLGGRMEGGPKMIGDEEIFIIPCEGRPTWFKTQMPLVDVYPRTQLPSNVPAVNVQMPEVPRSLSWARVP